MRTAQKFDRGAFAAQPRGSRTSRIVNTAIDRPWALIIVAGLAVFGFWFNSTRHSDHTIRAAFTSAVSIAPGLDVQVDGIDVGKIGKVEYVDGQALVDIGVNNDAWPLHQGTTATLRFGTTLGNGTRLVDLVPGPPNAPEIAERGIIPTRDTVSPVEFDQVFNTFDPATRTAFRSFFDGGARNLSTRAPKINRGLPRAATALESTSDLFTDLGADEAALRRLVGAGHSATRALASQRAQISDLMTVSAATFDTFARNTDGIRRSLDEFAPTLVDARTTLRRADRSIAGLDGLVTDLRPAVAALQPFTTAARPAAEDLRTLAPAAVSTLTTLRDGGPAIASFLKTGIPFMQRLAPVLRTGGAQLACIRPYAPEIAAFFSNWGSWAQGYDNSSHYGRIKAVLNASSFTSYPPTKTNEFLGTAGVNLKYAMPRPPGLNAGKPWFLPECGAGPAAIDPTKDPEDK